MINYYRRSDQSIYAASLSLTGLHTPGVNQDHIYVCPPEHLADDSGGESVLALLADGMTGEEEEKRLLTGDFVAKKIVQIFPKIFHRISNETPDLETIDIVPDAIQESMLNIRNDFPDYLLAKNGSMPSENVYGATTFSGAIRNRSGGITVFCNGNSFPWVIGPGATVIHTTPVFRANSPYGYAVTWETNGKMEIRHFSNQFTSFSLSSQQIQGTTLCMVSDGLLSAWYLEVDDWPRGPRILSKNPQNEINVINCFSKDHAPDYAIKLLEMYAHTFEQKKNFDDRTAVLVSL